eukprot:m.77418 g.77418  ORF g.77418 m.77418 type:complete len:477 (+) comp9135_c0_seq2:153-1583(+)
MEEASYGRSAHAHRRPHISTRRRSTWLRASMACFGLLTRASPSLATNDLTTSLPAVEEENILMANAVTPTKVPPRKGCHALARAGMHMGGEVMHPGEWVQLPKSQLASYFTSEELMGIETQSCGPLQDSEGNIRWISGFSNSAPEYVNSGTEGPSYISGPCCPNGHTYGWFGKEHNTTEDYTKVQVVNGVQTKPFRILRLIECLQYSCDIAVPRQRYVVWFQGDSTQIQFYMAFFCALIRAGGIVNMCVKAADGHYGHRGCKQVKSILNDEGLYGKASVTLLGTEWVLKLVPEITNVTMGGCNHDDADDHPDCPNIVFVNRGLHIPLRRKGPEFYEQDIREYTESLFRLPYPISSRIVWRETVLQHFPGPDGDYNHRVDTTSERCIERVNLSVPTAVYRMHLAHKAIMDTARDFKRSPPPFITLEGVEANSGHLFPLAQGLDKTGNSKLDCTHRTYTPLYWDAVFDAVATTLCGYL